MLSSVLEPYDLEQQEPPHESRGCKQEQQREGGWSFSERPPAKVEKGFLFGEMVKANTCCLKTALKPRKGRKPGTAMEDTLAHCDPGRAEELRQLFPSVPVQSEQPCVSLVCCHQHSCGSHAAYCPTVR